MLVLGSLLVLSTIAVEFAYNTHVSYEVAASERDRLQAYYLARSALNLIRLELKTERQLRTTYAGLLKNLTGTGVTSDPLCKQIPFSTEFLKGLASGALLGGGETAEEGKKEEEKKEEGGEKTPPQEGEAVAGAEEFLDFTGDFDVTCDTEERKINLNVFRADPIPEGATGTTGTSSLYDAQKDMLFALLSQKEFEPIFEGKPDEIRKVVNAIADWADRDDRINEAPGVAGGSEDSEYSGYRYKVKNGKYATVAEILLVAGVGDDLYQKLAPQITVYGDNKINLCQASPELVRAFVFRISQSTPGVAPIAKDDEEKLNAAVDQILFACGDPAPTPANVANAIATALGASSIPGLDKQITTTNRFFRIEATGRVNESRVRVAAVLDTAGANPNLWKTLYYRVE
jgi:type II secretory pathway component PulK